MNRLVVLTGASASGKTSIVEEIGRKASGTIDLALLHFDSIGVPSSEAMIRDYGSGENWQKAMTDRWMRTIKDEYLRSSHAILEGQMRISFIKEAMVTNGIEDYRIILVDCDDATRSHRLEKLRVQPELNNVKMMHWAKYLRKEARVGKHKILDTTTTSLEAACSQVVAQFSDFVA